MADEVAHIRPRVGGDIEQLALERARPRVAGDVAHRIAAPLARGQAGVTQLADQLGRIRQRNVMHLDVLAGSDVALAQRDVAVDHLGEGIELVGSDTAHRQLDANHLNRRLPLSVDALLEAELDELVLLDLALEETGRFGIEVVELALEDRDHVPRDILDHLGVLERAGTSLRFSRGAWKRGGFHVSFRSPGNEP